MIFAYQDEIKVERLINSLDYNCDFFIHVDKKINILPFKERLKNKSNVYFVKERFKVYWGGWSQVKAIMSMLSSAIELNKNNYSHIILITETDYPIKTNKEIENFLTSHIDTEFVMALDCVTNGDKEKINRIWWFDYYIDLPRIRKWITRIGNRVILPFLKKKQYCYLNKKKVHPFFGQMLFAVTPKCAAYIINVYKNDKKFNSYMKTVYVPCEFYYQTIIFNSPFREKTCEHGQEHQYTQDFSWAPLHMYDYSTVIKIYKEDDFKMIADSKYLFFRKAIRGKSDKLMDLIDEMREKNAS